MINIELAIEKGTIVGEPIYDQHNCIVDFKCLVCGLSIAAHDELDDCMSAIKAAALRSM